MFSFGSPPHIKMGSVQTPSKNKPQHTVLFCLCIFAASCATTRVTVKVKPAEAEVYKLDTKTPDARGTLLGKGEVILTADSIKNGLISVESKDFERLLLFLPDTQEDGVIEVALKPSDLDNQRRLADAEAKLQTALSQIASETEQREKAVKAIHKISRLIALLQKYVMLQADKEGDLVANELFALPENLLPASAYTLRGKLRMLQKRNSDAKNDFQKAVSLWEEEKEAKRLLEIIK